MSALLKVDSTQFEPSHLLIPLSSPWHSILPSLSPSSNSLTNQLPQPLSKTSSEPGTRDILGQLLNAGSHEVTHMCMFSTSAQPCY